MKSLIAIIAALTVGGIGGWAFNNQPGPMTEMSTEQTQLALDNMPVAEDFVSLRPSLQTLPSESISDAELNGLLYMREEEKLARDVYTYLYEKWGLPIFSNIAQSEQTHTEAVRDLLVKYNVSDPVTDDSIGVFTNADLQKLYTDLTNKGLVSVEEALKVGALIEDLDIYDLSQEIAKADNQDIIMVYENLTRGSENHLRSFTSQLTSRGENYTPEYITESEYNSIISTDTERGGGNSSNKAGSKAGRGWGNR